MHIDNDRYQQRLSSLEQAHLDTCKTCQAEYEAVIALRKSAEHIELLHPDGDTWGQLSKRLPEAASKPSYFKQVALGTAATVLFTSLGWLMWSQYTVQQQLDHVLLSNMMLEDKIHYQQQITFKQASVIHELRELDVRLMASKTIKEKIDILLERRRLMTEHLAKPQEESNEISI